MTIKKINESLEKMFTPPQRKISGIILVVGSIALTTLAVLAAGGILGTGLDGVAVGLAVGAVILAAGGAFLGRPTQKPFQVVGNEETATRDTPKKMEKLT